MGVRVDMALEIHGRFVHPVSRFFFLVPGQVSWIGCSGEVGKTA